jgi:hypothetical protein
MRISGYRAVKLPTAGFRKEIDKRDLGMQQFLEINASGQELIGAFEPRGEKVSADYDAFGIFVYRIPEQLLIERYPPVQIACEYDSHDTRLKLPSCFSLFGIIIIHTIIV